MISVSRLPADNPFGRRRRRAARSPPKPPFPELPVTTSLFAAVRVDPTGKVVARSRLVRDPVPSVVPRNHGGLSSSAGPSIPPSGRASPSKSGGATVSTCRSMCGRGRSRRPDTHHPDDSPCRSLSSGATTRSGTTVSRPRLPPSGTVALEQVDSMTKSEEDPVGRGLLQRSLLLQVLGAHQRQRLHRQVDPDPGQRSGPDPLHAESRDDLARCGRARVKSQPVESWCELSVSGQLSLRDRRQADQQPAQDVRDPVTVATRGARTCAFGAPARGLRPDAASTASLVPRSALAPAARASSLGYFGRLRAPRA